MMWVWLKLIPKKKKIKLDNIYLADASKNALVWTNTVTTNLVKSIQLWKYIGVNKNI